MGSIILSAIDEKQSDWSPASKRANRSADTRVRSVLGSLLQARRASISISGKCIGSHTIKEVDPFFNALLGEQGVQENGVESSIQAQVDLMYLPSDICSHAERRELSSGQRTQHHSVPK